MMRPIPPGKFNLREIKQVFPDVLSGSLVQADKILAPDGAGDHQVMKIAVADRGFQAPGGQCSHHPLLQGKTG